MKENVKGKYQEELSEELFELRNSLSKNGIELHKETFSCGKAYISVRIVLLDKKVYLVKRVNRVCTKIVCINDLVKKSREE
nr:MAG TPA: hypothetical protein [Caudoviricetes sp.]